METINAVYPGMKALICPVCGQKSFHISGNPSLIGGDVTFKCKKCKSIISIKKALQTVK